MDKHIFTILPNVDYNEHTKLPPTKEFCKVVHATLKAIDESTKAVSFVTSRRITADLAEYVLNCDGHYKLDVTRYPTLRTALSRPELSASRVCEFVLFTGENPLEVDDDAAWQKFCMRAVSVGSCKATLYQLKDDPFRFPGFDKEAFLKKWQSPSTLYVVPGEQGVDSVMPAPSTIKRLTKTMDLLCEDDDAVAVFVGGKSGDAAISEAMLMCGYMESTHQRPNRNIPARVAVITSGSTLEEKAELSRDFISTVGRNAKETCLIVNGNQVTEVKEIAALDQYDLVEEQAEEEDEDLLEALRAKYPTVQAPTEDEANPAVSGVAETTEAVDGTGAPDVTGAADVVDALEVDDLPKVVEAPVVVDAPEVADAPEVVDAPVVADAPEVVDDTEEVAAPEVTHAPEAEEAEEAEYAPAADDAPAVNSKVITILSVECAEEDTVKMVEEYMEYRPKSSSAASFLTNLKEEHAEPAPAEDLPMDLPGTTVEASA